MKKTAFAAIAIILLALVLYIAVSMSSTRPPAAPQSALSTSTPPAPYAVPALTKDYRNSAYSFALKMPADFTASESSDPSASSATIVLQNTTGDGIQIVVSPWSEDTSGSYTLTADRIHQDLPDLTITDQQPVDIGTNYVGLAFRSDNQAFNGDSREVWFVFDHRLYQISTYARLDPLLKAIFATWNFN